MSTKLTAARLATTAGVTTIITRSSTPSNIFQIVAYIQSLKQDSTTCTPSISRNNSHTALPELLHSQDQLVCSPPASVSIPRPPKPLHTRFLPKPRAIRDRYFWLLHGLKPHGTLIIDEGAYRALTRRDKAGLLPVGILDVQGTFAQQECVSLVVGSRTAPLTDATAAAPGGYDIIGGGLEVGRALVNYTSVEIGRIKGFQSSSIHNILGYAGKYKIIK
jgi:glutamate 5-kinase